MMPTLHAQPDADARRLRYLRVRPPLCRVPNRPDTMKSLRFPALGDGAHAGEWLRARPDFDSTHRRRRGVTAARQRE